MINVSCSMTQSSDAGEGCTKEILSIVGLCRIHLHVFVNYFKRINDVTPSSSMTDVIYCNNVS